MAEVSAPADRCLQVGAIPHPGCARSHVRFFRDWYHAYLHLRDHVLTAPECLAWAVVIPEYAGVVDPHDANARFRYVEGARQSQGASAQALYDLYRQAAALDAQDAATLGWVNTGAGVTVSLGTSGICILIEDNVVNTAFLPGQGDAAATRQARDQANKINDASCVRGLPRERGMPSGRTPHRNLSGSRREQRAREQRRQQRTPLEDLYYEVFKRSVQFIRQMHHACRNMYGEEICGDYARLKHRLPRRSQLKFEDWIELRSRCRENQA